MDLDTWKEIVLFWNLTRISILFFCCCWFYIVCLSDQNSSGFFCFVTWLLLIQFPSNGLRFRVTTRAWNHEQVLVSWVYQAMWSPTLSWLPFLKQWKVGRGKGKKKASSWKLSSSLSLHPKWQCHHRAHWTSRETGDTGLGAVFPVKLWGYQRKKGEMYCF